MKKPRTAKLKKGAVSKKYQPKGRASYGETVADRIAQSAHRISAQFGRALVRLSER